MAQPVFIYIYSAFCYQYFAVYFFRQHYHCYETQVTTSTIGHQNQTSTNGKHCIKTQEHGLCIARAVLLVFPTSRTCRVWTYIYRSMGRVWTYIYRSMGRVWTYIYRSMVQGVDLYIQVHGAGY